MDEEGNNLVFKVSLLAVISLCVFIGIGMWGCPRYNVWEKSLSGKARLRQAEWTRQIKVKEAKAERESAIYKKEADSIRAEGTAIANSIIAKSLTKDYIQWKWVEGLHDGSSEVIYVPTENQLPILEATRKMSKP